MQQRLSGVACWPGGSFYVHDGCVNTVIAHQMNKRGATGLLCSCGKWAYRRQPCPSAMSYVANTQSAPAGAMVQPQPAKNMMYGCAKFLQSQHTTLRVREKQLIVRACQCYAVQLRAETAVPLDLYGQVTMLASWMVTCTWLDADDGRATEV